MHNQVIGKNAIIYYKHAILKEGIGIQLPVPFEYKKHMLNAYFLVNIGSSHKNWCQFN